MSSTEQCSQDYEALIKAYESLPQEQKTREQALGHAAIPNAVLGYN